MPADEGIRAFLFQNYHQDCRTSIRRSRTISFSVLGKIADFRNGTAILNLADFKAWLAANDAKLQARVASWIPKS